MPAASPTAPATSSTGRRGRRGETLIGDVTVRFGHHAVGDGGTYEEPERFIDWYVAQFTIDGAEFKVISKKPDPGGIPGDGPFPPGRGRPQSRRDRFLCAGKRRPALRHPPARQAREGLGGPYGHDKSRGSPKGCPRLFPSPAIRTDPPRSRQAGGRLRYISAKIFPLFGNCSPGRAPWGCPANILYRDRKNPIILKKHAEGTGEPS